MYNSTSPSSANGKEARFQFMRVLFKQSTDRPWGQILDNWSRQNCLLLPQPPLYSAGPSALSLTEHFMHLAVSIVSSFKYLLQKVLFLKATNNLDFFQTTVTLDKGKIKILYINVQYTLHCLLWCAIFSF